MRGLLILVVMALLLAGCGRRAGVTAPSPAPVPDEYSHWIEEGDRLLQLDHLWGWREAEKLYLQAIRLRAEPDLQRRVAVTSFLIHRRHEEEGIFSSEDPARVGRICSFPDPLARILCRAVSGWGLGPEDRTFLSAAEDLEPVLRDYLHLLLAEGQDPEEKAGDLDRFLEEYPSHPLALYLAMRQGTRLDPAEALEQHRHFAELHLDLAERLAGRKAYLEAIPHYLKTLELIPDFTRASNALGSFHLYTLNDYSGALELYRRTLQYDGRDLAALFGAGVAFHFLGEYPESLEMLDRLISPGQARWSAVPEGLHDHYRGQSAYFKARSFHRLQQPEEARKWVDLAREKQPASDEIRYLSAVLYKDDSRTEEARLELEEVVRDGTAICEAYHLLGLISLEEGRAFTDYFLSAGYCLERSLRNMEEKLEEFGRLALPPELRALGLEQRRERLEIARIEAHELLAQMLSILDPRREAGGRISADALLEVIERIWKREDD